MARSYFYQSKKCAIADLEYLSPDCLSHLTCQIEAGIRLIHRITLRSRKIHIMTAMFQHLASTGLFSGFYIQMIKVGSRSGHLDRVMEEISGDYEEAADASIDNMIARFEPTIVAVLAVSVGLVLLSVMLPLVGVLSAIG